MKPCEFERPNSARVVVPSEPREQSVKRFGLRRVLLQLHSFERSMPASPAAESFRASAPLSWGVETRRNSGFHANRILDSRRLFPRSNHDPSGRCSGRTTAGSHLGSELHLTFRDERITVVFIRNRASRQSDNVNGPGEAQKTPEQPTLAPTRTSH